MNRRRIGTTAAIALALLVIPDLANAQEWLKDRRYGEGAGVRAGDFELHPGLAAEIGYDSNWFLRSEKTGPNIINGAPAAPVEGSGVLRITPSFSIATASERRRVSEGGAPELPSIRFRGGASATYRDFFFNENAYGKPFWGTTNKSQTNVSATADARLEILPERPWGANLFAGYTRLIQPMVVGNPDVSFNRSNINGGLEVVAQPGGGTLDWRLGYQAAASIFEDSFADPFDNVTHELSTRGRWKFRPRTALLHDTTVRWLTYSSKVASATTSLHDSTPIRTRIGLNGLISPRFAFLGMVGWGSSFYRSTDGVRGNTQQFNSIIGQAEARFFLSANPSADEPSAVGLALSTLMIGYQRDFQNSLLGDFYGLDRGYLRLQYYFAQRAVVNLEGGVGAIQYPSILNQDGTVNHNPFTDIRMDATLFGEYRVTETVGINTTLRFTGNFSQNQLNVASPTGTNLVFDMNWKRFEAYLGARWFL